MADGASRDERTEEATPRKLEQSREKGQVAYSTESVAAAGLVVGAGAFLVGGGLLASTVGERIVMATELARDLGVGDLDTSTVSGLLSGIAAAVLPALLAIIGPMAIAALLVGGGQVGLRLAPKALSVDWTKLSPVKGFERMVGARGWVRTGLALLKIGSIAGVLLVAGYLQMGGLVRMGAVDLGPMLAALGTILLRSIAAVLAVVVALALLDFLFQRFQFLREMRMTKQEIKEEMKESEGDPHLKARVRAVQREMAQRRMMQAVPEATVVVTNPTHFAVALAYPRDEEGAPLLEAPIVVAKGVDLIAQRIKGLAKESGVPLYEDRPLARAMYAQVELGQPVPTDLYAAVATVLAHVYRAGQQAGPSTRARRAPAMAAR